MVLLFNLVEISISPTEWYNYLPTMDMRRCVVLGDFLRSNKIPSLGNLDSVCTALGVSKPFVRFRIIRVSEARQMKFNEAVGAFRSIEGKAIKEEKILDIVQEWLMVGKQTVELLELSKGEIFEEWQHEILTRATQFLQLVVNPRLFMLRRRMGLQTEASEDDIVRVKYLYTAMQQERSVPLQLYSIDVGPTLILACGDLYS